MSMKSDEVENSKLQFMSTYYVPGPFYALSLITRAALQGRDVD